MPKYNIANGTLALRRAKARIAAKPMVGRPPVTDRDTGARYQVYLLPADVAKLRALGSGSLSAGIVAALAAAK